MPWKLQENILAESSAMLPDTRQRLEEALKDLQTMVVSCLTLCLNRQFATLRSHAQHTDTVFALAGGAGRELGGQ
jgi:hypothetical protein